MRCLKPSSSRRAAAAAWLGLSLLGPAAHAAGDAAEQACEQAARQALTAGATRPADVTFTVAPVVQASLSNDSQLVLRGVARWQGAGVIRSVTYNCNVDPRSSEVTGLVMRDSTPIAAVAAPAPAEPDLSTLSPEACEARAAEALKQRWPRVSEISFDTATRSFRQQSGSKAELHGSGRAVPDPRSPPTYFAFDCEIDPRDGRVQRTSLSW
jgi:hypothetical protein